MQLLVEQGRRQRSPIKGMRPSLAFRLALFYGVVFAGSAAILIAVVSWATTSSLIQQRDQAISDELNELKLEATSGGIDEIKREIAERDNEPGKSQFIYVLSDGNKHLIAGTALQVPRVAGWSDVNSPTGDPDDLTHTIHFRSLLLPGGLLLAVGEDTDQVDDLREFISTAFVAGLGGALLLALAGAALLSWAFRRRLNRVAAVCKEITIGNLSLRVPTSSGDEIDIMATSINAMLDRIVALMDTLQQVTVDVAHDMRTPLARVRQGLETAEMKAKTTGEYSAAVQKAVGEIDTVLETFAALLRIAELRAGALRSTFKTIDLSHVLRTVADAYAPLGEESGQHLEARITPGILVAGDENLLTQMIANLVANALKHTPRGTTVEVAITNSGGHPIVMVADNGPGIPEADRARVFQRFVRLERSRSTPGSGLGLSVAAAIAELHGVKIELKDNHPGLRCELAFE